MKAFHTASDKSLGDKPGDESRVVMTHLTEQFHSGLCRTLGEERREREREMVLSRELLHCYRGST